MKLSNFNKMFQILKDMGLSITPEAITSKEMQELSENPKIRELFLQAYKEANFDFYQELEMESPYVDTHRDISFRPELLHLHSHPFYEIIYCESGNIQYLIADKRYHVRAGDIILVPPGISHRPLFYHEMTEPYSRIVLWVSTEFLRGLRSLCPDDFIHEIATKDYFLLRTEGTPYAYLEDYFKQGLTEALNTSPLWDIALYSNTANLLVHLSRCLLSADSSNSLEIKEDIDRIITYVENHYSEKITLESTTKEFHISTSTLGKLFYNKLNISFYHFVTQRRLINSKLKIEEGYSMEEVALECGFCDYSAFYRAFKKEYGISPREYKKLISFNELD